MRAVKTVSTKFNGDLEVISKNEAWRHKCTIASFNTLEAQTPRRTELVSGMPRS